MIVDAKAMPDTLTTKRRYWSPDYDDPGALRVPINTYAGAWRTEDLPEPEKLKRFCDEFVTRLANGTNTLAQLWLRSEGEPSGVNLPIEFKDCPEQERDFVLIERLPWQFETWEDFDSCQSWTTLRCRYGVIDRKYLESVL